MKNKRILLIGPFPPPIGGVSVSSQRLYEHLIIEGYIVDKYDVRFPFKKPYNNKILRILRIAIFPFYLIANKRYDVIHFNISGTLIRLYISFWRTFFSKKTKFISTIHGDVSNLLISRFGKSCLSGFDLVICVKEGDKAILQKHFKKPVAEIPAFIPPVIADDYEKLIPDEVNKFITKDNLPIIIWNGLILTDGKYFDLYGLKIMVTVFIDLINSGVEAKLLLLLLGEITGIKQKSCLEEINSLIDNNNLSDLILVYRVTNSDLWPILKKSSVFVRPTLTDGDALSVREALYFNIPVVASDVAQRPLGTIVYNVRDDNDLLIKLREVLVKKDKSIGIKNNYAYKIIEQYEAN